MSESRGGDTNQPEAPRSFLAGGSAEPDPTSPARSPTILVVDDSETVRFATSEILREAGFEVEEAATGADALRAAAASPDAIILDIRLPDFDGFEVCRRLKTDPATAAIPVLHLSGVYRGLEDKVRGLEIGADAYLMAPAEPTELLATVRALLRLRRAETGLRESEARRDAAEALAHVGRLLAASLDVGEVARRIVESVRTILGAQAASLHRLDPASGDLLPLAVSGTVGPAFERSLVIPRGIGLSGIAVRERRPAVTRDLLADPRIPLSPEFRARVEQAPYRAVLAVPLMVQDRVIGALGVGDRAGRIFGDDEIRLAQAFADQAAVALENARLFAETRERLEQTETLLAVGQGLSVNRPIPEALRQVARTIARAFGADMVGAYVLDTQTAAFVPIAGYHVPHDLLPTLLQSPFPLARFPFLQEACTTRRPVWTSDYQSDPRFDQTFLEPYQPQSMLFAPTLVLGEVVGGLFLVWWTQARVCRPSELRLIEGVASQVGLTLERTRGEDALRESEERFRSAFESAGIGMALQATDGRYLRVNRVLCEVVGYSEVELLGMSYPDIVHPEERATDLTNDGRMLAGEIGSYQVEKRYLHKDGRVVWVLASVSLVRGGHGEPLYFVAQVQDITDGKRAEQVRAELEAQLRQAQKMDAIGQLAGGVAHDFNNLLTVIQGRSELLLQRTRPDGPARRHLDLIEKTAKRAAALTSQLLAFSRKQVLQPKVLDLNTVVAGMERMLRRLIGEDIDLVTVVGAALGSVRADPAQLEQVILNLAVNARDAMPQGGRLTLETANVEVNAPKGDRPGAPPLGSYVRLAVADTGVGMDADTQAHLFEPFFTTKGPGKGTGLGLATVYGIVAQSDGFIDVCSEPGRGTTLALYFPRIHAAAEPAASTPRLTHARHGSETILLVEDEDLVREFTREILELHGYAVLEARHPGEALLIGERHRGPIHLMVTDVVMPQMNGRELADRLATGRPEMRVLYISGYTGDAIAQHGIVESGRGFLPKPFTPDALADKVRGVLGAIPESHS